jgi:hypothetical protein
LFAAIHDLDLQQDCSVAYKGRANATQQDVSSIFLCGDSKGGGHLTRLRYISQTTLT